MPTDRGDGPPSPADTLVLAGIGVAAMIACAAIASRHPGVFSDFVMSSGRARAIALGAGPPDGTWPAGVPLLLAALEPVTGDVRVAGGALALVGAGLAVGAAGRIGGVTAAAWLAAQGAFLEWGATEGSDMLAAGLSLASLAAASEQRAVAAGVFAAAAGFVRWPAAIAIAPACFACADRPRVLATFVAASLAHPLAAMLGIGPWFPEASRTAAIGGGESWAAWLLRWPVSTGHAALVTVSDPAIALSAVALVVRARHDARARALGVLALGHVAVLGLFFANPRLALPATLACALGVPALDRYRVAVVALAVALGTSHAVRLSAPDREEVEAHGASEAASAIGGAWVTTSPSFYVRDGGWVLPVPSIRELGPPDSLDPRSLAAGMDARGECCVALERGRVRTQFRSLGPLLAADPPAGWTLVADVPGWRLLRRA